MSEFTFQLGAHELAPLIIGGMGVDISTAELALEAARAGAVGHISDAMGPYVSDKRFRTHYQAAKRKQYAHLKVSDPKTEVKWNPEVVRQASINHVEWTMAQKKGDGLIFINCMEKLTMGAPTETLQARLRGALDGGIDGITLSAGLHIGSLALIEDHPRFRDAFIGIIVSSVRALKIFLRSARRVNRVPDYIIVEGPLAGGHLGFGEDWREHDLRTIVIEVLEFLRSESLSIPVIPAGGVFTGSDGVSFLELGAAACQVATRFTISQECGLPTHVKQLYLRAREEDVVVNCSSPTGYLMRMLKSSPSLRSNVAPNCEALGYLLDKDGQCAYHEAYAKAPVGPDGEKLPITEKMCICYHFMKYDCYTCGHYVYRLKDTTTKLPNGDYYLPPAREIILDYLESEDYEIRVLRPPPCELEHPTEEVRGGAGLAAVVA